MSTQVGFEFECTSLSLLEFMEKIKRRTLGIYGKDYLNLVIYHGYMRVTLMRFSVCKRLQEKEGGGAQNLSAILRV